MKDILPCPRCGAEAKVKEHDFGDCHSELRYECECKNGHSWDEWFDTPEEAIKSWNERPVVSHPKKNQMQLYDIKEDRGYPEPEIVPDNLGSYYRAEEVDEQIAALQLYKDTTLGKESERERQIDALTAEVKNWKDTAGFEADGLESWKKEAERLTAENEVLREQNFAMNASLVKLRSENEKLNAAQYRGPNCKDCSMHGNYDEGGGE